ncbi:MAG: hypothetical protein AAF547_04750 [Actinomycetota bacterium]
MSYVGTGDEDWVELDLDLFERAQASRLASALVDHRQQVVAAIGFDFEVDTADDGTVYIMVEGRRRFRADVSRDDRLIFTGLLDPEGPL